MKLTVAAARYTIAAPADYPSFAARVSAHVAAAAARGANLVVLPEYLALEAAAGQPSEVRGDFVRSLAALQAHRKGHAIHAHPFQRAGEGRGIAGDIRQDVLGRFVHRAILPVDG